MLNLDSLTESQGSSQLLRGRCILALAIVLFVCVFALGGSSRADVASLQILRPLFVIGLGLAVMTFRREHVRNYGLILGIAFSYVALIMLQNIPFPHDVTAQFSGQGITSQIYSATGVGPLGLPIAMAPLATLNSLWAVVLPLAIMLVAIQLTVEEHRKLLVAVLGMGGVSALIALLQIMGDPESSLYFFKTTNYGSAVGLFANRNHQAALLACLIPLIFASIQHPNPNEGRRWIGSKASVQREIMALVAVAVLIILILISGSRSGLLLGAIGLTSLVLSKVRMDKPVGSSASTSTRAVKFGVIVAFLLAVVLAAVWFQRALAIDRLMVRDPSADIRLRTLSTAYELIWIHQPLGLGLGGFSDVYKVYEPSGLLMAQHMNQVHNDWIDIAMSGGVLFVIVIAAAVCWLASKAVQVFARHDQEYSSLLQKAGFAVLVILAVASASDYPLRTPALSCLFALALIWVGLPKSRSIRVEPASVDRVIRK